MKILKIALITLALLLAGTGVYYFFIRKMPEKKSLENYLNSEALVYLKPENTFLSSFDKSLNVKQSKLIGFLQELPDSSPLKVAYSLSHSIVSYHLNRQMEPIAVLWLFVDDSYSLNDDTLLVGEWIDDLFELKTRNSNLFAAATNGLVALGASGELMKNISEKSLAIEPELIEMPQHKLAGNIQYVKHYIERHHPYFEHLLVPGNMYHVSHVGTDSLAMFNGAISDVSSVCSGVGKGIFNNAIPYSAKAGWRYTFSDVKCLNQLINDHFGQALWDVEDRYQFKLSSLLEAWVQGTITWFYFDNGSSHGSVAALKLRSDAVPFAASNRFFADLQTIKARVSENEQRYTIARFVPNGVAPVLFAGAAVNEALYAMQVDSYLYLATDKQLLSLVINELVNKRYLAGFSEHPDASGEFFFMLPNHHETDNIDGTKNTQIQRMLKGKLMHAGNELHLQGTVFVK
ncbi:MAG: hypothetical protein PF489_05975 [Salinivirgaceae bacterium]|nr:hypothetical protein [Salinivirgaceae bacterium]